MSTDVVTCGAVSGTEEPRKPVISGPTNCNPCDIQQVEQEPWSVSWFDVTLVSYPVENRSFR
jgi:hypothetical protein